MRIKWPAYAFYLFNEDCQRAAHTISVITLTICFYGIWVPLKHHHGLILLKREELLGTTSLTLMVIFYLSTAGLLYYGSLSRIPELYLPYIFVHAGKILYDCFEIVRSLSQSLHYLRLSLRDRSISELIYFPTKLEWNYQSTASEKFRIVGFTFIEILFRVYVVCVVWHAWSQLQSEVEKLSNKLPKDIESNSSTENQQVGRLLEEAEDPRLDAHVNFIEKF